jgi:integrase/recombinase XerD
MSSPHPPFTAMVRDFFERHLIVERQVSRNTLVAYRDAMRLFLRFLDRPAEALDFDVLSVDIVRAFLHWLQTERECSPRTRNHRLAVLKSFAAFVALVDPRHLERCRQVRQLPRAKVERPEPDWLTTQELDCLIKAVRPAHRERDRALLLLMYDTGARVQEIVDLNVRDIHDESRAFVQFQAKGGRQRTNVLGDATVTAIKRWLTVRGTPALDAPVFVNTRGERITRSGISWIVERTAKRAQLEPEHAARVTPHVIRHTTAMHLLEADVDITTVAAWLGHASLETTNEYVQITLRMKQEALASLEQPEILNDASYPEGPLVAWLDALCSTPRYAQKREAETPTFLHRGSPLRITGGCA